MRNNTHFIWLKASLQCYCMSCPITVKKNHRNVALPDYRSLFTQNVRDGQRIRYLRVWQFNSLRGLGIDIIGRVHFDNRDRFSISMGSIGKATEPCQQITEWLLTSDFWLFLEPWHARWYKYEIFISSCTDSIYIWLGNWEVIVWRHHWSCWDLWI